MPQPKKTKILLIDRALIQKFCKENDLKGAVEFLHYISKKGLIDFSNFLRNYNIQLPPSGNTQVLFHGSKDLIAVLQTNISISDTNTNKNELFVYATNNPNYAIFLAIINIQEDGTASVVVEKGRTKLSINNGFINGPSCLGDGFVHVIDGSGFEKLENDEYASQSSKPTMFAFRVKPDDLTEPIIVKTTKLY